MGTTRNARLFKKLLLITVMLVVVAGGVASAMLIRKKNSPKVSPTPQPTIKQLPPQPAANGGEKTVSSNTGTDDGTAIDTKGQPTGPVPTDESQWLRSASGVVTVQTPTAKSTVKSGFELVGTATVGQVRYRLTDNSVGVVSQGFISVVNGKFSATISFVQKSKSGRLDVFTVDDNDVESNEVQVDLAF